MSSPSKQNVSERSGKYTPLQRNSNNGSPCCGKRPRTPRSEEQPYILFSAEMNKPSEDYATTEGSVETVVGIEEQGKAEVVEQQPSNDGVAGNEHLFETSEGEPSTKMARSCSTGPASEGSSEVGDELSKRSQGIKDDRMRSQASSFEGEREAVKPSAKLPLATSLSDYMVPGATKRFRPRPEWYTDLWKPQSAAYRSDGSVPAAASASRSPARYQPTQQIPFPPGLMVAPENGLLSDGAFAGFFDESASQDDSLQAGNPLYIPQLHYNENDHDDTDDTVQHPVVSASDAASFHGQGETEEEATSPCTFGRDLDPALHVTIRENATEAAFALLERGAPIEAENSKGVTPLILASQKGNLEIVEELLNRGANPLRSSSNGTTAVLQAAHFGHEQVLDLLLRLGGTALMEMANFNHTTPLMRAAQEGHLKIVQNLLERGASVNRRNRVQMTALMLASQRGHAVMCQELVNKGAEVDSMTGQHSTSLLLATKRGHVDVARVLISAGCELWVQDARGRTAREVAQRRDIKDLISILDANVQLDWMQRMQRQRRNYDMILLWNLLQQERALVPIHSEDDLHPRHVTIHQIIDELQPRQLSIKKCNMPAALPYHLSQLSSQALLRTMALPIPLVELITKYIPMPHLWERRVGMLTKRSVINANATITCALDLIDEILEEGGFVEACDFAKVTPPTHFKTWREWKMYCRLHCRRGGPVSLPDDNPRDRSVATTATVPKPRQQPYAVVEMRRQVGFLQLLANRTPLLARVLASPPFNVPAPLIQQLITTSDIQSLVRRMGSRGVRFEPPVAMDLIMLVSRLCSWYAREREDKPYPIFPAMADPLLPQTQPPRSFPVRIISTTTSGPFLYHQRYDEREEDHGYRSPAPGHDI